MGRLAGRDPDQPKRIDQSLVEDIGTAIHLRVERERVGVDGFEVWTRERLITAFPGSGDDPEVRPTGDVDPEADPDRGRDEAPEPRHRLDRLLGCHVRFADGRDGDLVIDATLTRTDPHGPVLAHCGSKGWSSGVGGPGRSSATTVTRDRVPG